MMGERGGKLVKFDGAHDVNVLGFSLTRSRMLCGGGVLRWLTAPMFAIGTS